MADGGIAPDTVLAMLRGLANTIRPTCDPAAWWIIEDDEIIGLCSITAGPTDAAIDIGYGVATSRQGRGAASRGVGEVLKWATERPDLIAVTAETSVANLASQRVLERNGFQRAGTRTDAEDGELICWRKAVGA
ncbi:acetyltransferase GNAT family protein [Asticcacaulis biprosthecium C19]|uniref:Acetyltransferase GNAT family protein n=2 Tax=Asticcacaulis biprosthecium TaxID=76891 RepID=F4QT33_9CAUL|nr:acetyltransferase GNAT family protein [Asticcacaulis biprosthecium C19]